MYSLILILKLLMVSKFLFFLQFLGQFDDIGNQGTKIIIYNLWYTDDGTMELDFESDPQVQHYF